MEAAGQLTQLGEGQPQLLALLDENGPDELLRQVRAAEAVDPEGRQWPRTERSDDATAVYLVLANG